MGALLVLLCFYFLTIVWVVLVEKGVLAHSRRWIFSPFTV